MTPRTKTFIYSESRPTWADFRLLVLGAFLGIAVFLVLMGRGA